MLLSREFNHSSAILPIDNYPRDKRVDFWDKNKYKNDQNVNISVVSFFNLLSGINKHVSFFGTLDPRGFAKYGL